MKLFALLFFILFQSTSLLAEQGGCGGHGGDSYSLEFYRIGKQLAQEFLSWRAEEFAKLGVKFVPQEFANAVERTRIVSVTEPLILDGKPVDAINYTDGVIPRIELNRARWDSYAKNRSRKLAIVLHEYLGIVEGLYKNGEWDNYPLSSELLAIYERKHITDFETSYQSNLKNLKTAFASGTKFNANPTSKDFPISCIEYSALQGDTTKLIHQEAFLLVGKKNYGKWAPEATQTEDANALIREWKDVDPTEEVDHPQSMIREYMRVLPNGDIVTEVTTDYLYSNQNPSESDPKRGLLSYLYCSNVGSQTIAMMKFMFDSLSPMLNFTEGREYLKYVSEIKALAQSRAYKVCKEKKNSACLKVYKKLDEIKLPSESRALENAKTNIKTINTWLESLPSEDNRLALTPITNVYNRFLAHQSYIASLLDINDHRPGNPDPGLDNFVESLIYRVPLSCQAAKLTFTYELQEAVGTFIAQFKASR